MPNIKDQSTVEAIARVFCGEGKRNKTETLKIVGYSKGYSEGGRSAEVVWGNERVKEAVAKIDGEIRAETGRTITSLDKMYQTTYNLAARLNQPSAMNGSVTGIARLYGMDKDGKGVEETPKSLTVEDLAALRRFARLQTDRELSGPKLVKEA